MKEVSEEVCRRMREELRFFSFLEGPALSRLPGFFSGRQVEAGEVLWREGEPGDDLIFIIGGRLEAKKQTEFPDKDLVVGVFSTGTILGVLGFIDQRPRAITVVALEETELLLLSREQFERLLAEHPGPGIALLKGLVIALSTRLRQANERLAAIF
jgi:CRP/FNR family transcriptional regulator, cyclic AMP receptor protein